MQGQPGGGFQFGMNVGMQGYPPVNLYYRRTSILNMVDSQDFVLRVGLTQDLTTLPTQMILVIHLACSHLALT